METPNIPPKPPQIPQSPNVNNATTSPSQNPNNKLSSNYLLKRFYEITGTTAVNFPYPPYLKDIPPALRNEFLNSDLLITGFLRMKYPEVMKQIDDEINEILKSQFDLAQLTKKNLIEVLESIEPTNAKISEYNTLVQQFQTLQLQLYSELYEVSSKNLADHYEELVVQNQQNCMNLLSSIDKKQLSDLELDKFVEDFTKESYSKHMNKEFSVLCRHNRIPHLK